MLSFHQRDFKLRDWKKADKNFEGFIYLEEKENQLFPVKQPSENKIQLLEDGFQIQTVKWQEIPLILLLGGGRPGLIYAVNELSQKILSYQGEEIIIPKIDLEQSPLLPYRLLWTWDHSTNWYLEQVGIQEIGAMNYYSKPPEGFLEDYFRLIDFMSLNRIGGVTIYGFLRDCHGGIEAAQKLCKYASERGVRILPGVGINAYGGIYWEGNHRYNLTQWLRQRPELKAVLGAHFSF